MTKLVKNPLQRGHCKDAFTLLHFYNRVMGRTVLVTFLWRVVRHKQEVSTLVRHCASFGEMCPWEGGWTELAFCHLGVLPCPGVGLAPSRHKSNGLCIAEVLQGGPSSCSLSALLLVLATRLTRKLCQGESTARLHLKSPSSHPRTTGMRRRHSALPAKAFLLPLVCPCWV